MDEPIIEVRVDEDQQWSPKLDSADDIKLGCKSAQMEGETSDEWELMGVGGIGGHWRALDGTR